MTGFLASRFMTDLFDGTATGIIYALVALSLVIIWQSTGVLNFAQGFMAMFAAFIAMSQVEHGVPFWWCALLAVLAGLVIGGATERVLIRPLYGKPEINPIVVMVGFGSLLQYGAAAIWGGLSRPLPSPFSQIYYLLDNKVVQLSPYVVFQILTAFAVMGVVAVVFRFTKLGMQLRASALAPEVARLLGVRVGRMLTLGWMISSGVGAVAAIIVAAQAPVGLSPYYMAPIFVFGFLAAAIGGLESPIGAVFGGLLIGILDQFVTDYWNNNIATVVSFLVLVVVLMLRPQGLFTRVRERRV